MTSVGSTGAPQNVQRTATGPMLAPLTRAQRSSLLLRPRASIRTAGIEIPHTAACSNATRRPSAAGPDEPAPALIRGSPSSLLASSSPSPFPMSTSWRPSRCECEYGVCSSQGDRSAQDLVRPARGAGARGACAGRPGDGYHGELVSPASRSASRRSTRSCATTPRSRTGSCSPRSWPPAGACPTTSSTSIATSSCASTSSARRSWPPRVAVTASPSPDWRR